MSKNLQMVQNLKWESVALDGFPVLATDKFEGFVGLEECANYGLDNENKRAKNKKPTKKRQLPEPTTKEIPYKKMKLTNGFIVEDCKPVTPSTSNEIASITNKNIKNKQKKRQNNTDRVNNIENIAKNKSKPDKYTNTNTIRNGSYKNTNKPKLGETVGEVHNLTPEDMLTWAEFKLPEEILKALAELGFKKPTKIQQLALPAAIHGRRDILGAAETGSGKTLAFGLPILSGIMKLKEKAEAKGLDVYEIPYKKTSVKKKNIQSIESVKNGKFKKGIDKRNKGNSKAKESSEDGYSSGNENDDEMTKTDDSSKNYDKDAKSDDKFIKSNYKSDIKSAKDNEYLEEIEVPIRKKESSTDEGNESDSDSDNYIHLSEMLDSDDLCDSSDDKATENNDVSDADDNSGEESHSQNENNDNSEQCDDKNISGEKISSDNEEKSGDENVSEEMNSQDKDNEDEKGMGCVNVIDNVEIPGHVVIKTGKPLYALILTPTRELAMQISRHLIVAAKYTGIKIATIVGGMAVVKQERVLRSGPEVVVATPGRLWELINQGQPHLQQLQSVKFLAIDETDRMIERDHFDELRPLLDRLNADEVRRATRQNFVFSATLTLTHDLPSHMRGKKVTKRGKIINRKIEKMTSQQKIKKLIDMIGMSEPKVVDITTQNMGTADTLTECSIACSFDHKDAYLYYVLKRHPGRAIVFCNSIGCVKRLAQLLTLLKCRPLPLHASMPQRQRLKNLERFRDDPLGVLVATDVAARGLDIPDVDHVIHYQVPRTAENYVHRSGRTARANKEGLTILMMEPAEAYVYSKLCRTLNKTSVLPTFPVPGHLLTPMREIVTVARELDALELKKRRANQAIGWREKAARDMDMIIDDDDVPVQHIDPYINKALKVKRRQLDSMLSRPVFPKGFSYKYPTLNDATVFNAPEENALQVMKKALESGELKKEKRKGKNESLLELEKQLIK